MDTICNEIFELIESKLNIELKGNTDSLASSNVFSTGVNITPINMVYLMLLLENKYHINFTESDIDSADFYNVKGLSRIIYAHISIW